LETELCLNLQVEHSQLSPINRESVCLRTLQKTETEHSLCSVAF
jgi:hypothetical protein